MGGTAPHARYHHLYINGLYWGMYYVHERPDASFASDYLGGDRSDYDVLKHRSNTAVDGTTRNYNDMLSLARRDLSQKTNFDALAQVLDMTAFADYMLLNLYVGNTDWAHQNWYASFDRGSSNGKWRYHSWDAEHVLKSVNEDVTGKNDRGGPTEIHQNLRDNLEYRMLFADRVQKHFFGDGILTPENAGAEYQELMDEIDRAIVGETARWGDNRVNSPYTRDDWLRTQNNLLNNYFPSRTDRVLRQLRSDDLYPASSIATPSFFVDGVEQSGGSVTANAPITMTASSGTIYFTLDGSDPRTEGGGVAAQATAHTVPLIATDALSIHARLRTNDGAWSALTNATFYPNPLASVDSLVITELNYNPHESAASLGEISVDSDRFEFVELTNRSAETIELAGVKFVETMNRARVDGIRFAFPQTTLQPGERAVVVKDQAAFRSRYGDDVRVLGEYGGQLNDGGEQLRLLDAHDAVIAAFEFNDGGSWPTRADGVGSSLELIDLDADPSDGRAWRDSVDFGGSPGREGTPAPAGILINELLTHTDLPLIDQVELHNRTEVPISVANWFLSDSRGDLLTSRITVPTATVPANGYLVLTEDQLGFGFRGQENDDIWLVSTDSDGAPAHFVDYQRFGAAQNAVSLGRWPNGTGRLFPMMERTLGSANTGPLLPDIVIGEVQYHPSDEQAVEFVEITNVSTRVIDVRDWRLNDAIEFEFAAGQSQLAPGGTIVVVPFDPFEEPDQAAAFQARYATDISTALQGPFRGRLDNGGETIVLERPEDLLQLGVGYVLVDRVDYDEAAPWPTAADGQGASLHRRSASAYGDAAASWRAAPPSPGLAELATGTDHDLNNDGIVDDRDIDQLCRFINAGDALGDVNGDRNANADDLSYFVEVILNTSFGDANLDGVFDSSDLVQIFVAGQYEDGIPNNSQWRTGDWTCDAEFTSSDLVQAFLAGTYQA